MKLKARQAKLIALKFEKEPVQKVTSDDQPPPIPLTILKELTFRQENQHQEPEEWLEEKVPLSL